MNRLSLSTLGFAVALMMGCASPVDSEQTSESTDSTESAASGCNPLQDPDVICDGAGPGPNVYTFSVTDTTVSGVNYKGQTATGVFATSTTFRLANLSKFYPTEPHYPAAQAYNIAVQTGGDVLGAVSAFASVGSSHARFSVKNGAVFAFRPVP